MPLVDRFKFVTKGRWLTQICERYAKNKTNDLQLAFFNGDVSPKLSKFGAWQRRRHRKQQHRNNLLTRCALRVHRGLSLGRTFGGRGT